MTSMHNELVPDKSSDEIISELLNQNLELAQRNEELASEVAQYRRIAEFANRAAKNAIANKQVIANHRRTPYQMMIELHEVFNLPIRKASQFRDITSEERRACIEILREEFEDEYLEAEANNDLVGIADALGDMCIVAANTALKYGINLDAVLEEIHDSNMSKLGQDGKPVPHPTVAGKFGKGPNYFKPNLYPIIFGEGR